MWTASETVGLHDQCTTYHAADVVLNAWRCEQELTQLTPILLLIGHSNARKLRQRKDHEREVFFTQ